MVRYSIKQICIVLSLIIVLFESCTVEVYSGKTEQTEAQTHAMKINAVNEQIIDILTDVLYLDYCISDYRSNAINQELAPIYFPDTEMISNETSISIDRHRGIRLSVFTNETSIQENDSQWIIDAMISKLWGDYIEEGFRFTVCNVSDSYLMEGRVITNRLYEKGYFYSDLNLMFTKDIVPIQFTDLSKPETYIERETPLFIFDGNISFFFGDNGTPDETKPSYDIEVQSLKGYDHKEYIDSDPIYDGTTYFQSGKIDGIVHQNKQSDNRLIINVKNERNWELEYNGKTESYHPNNSPIRF